MNGAKNQIPIQNVREEQGRKDLIDPKMMFCIHTWIVNLPYGVKVCTTCGKEEKL